MAEPGKEVKALDARLASAIPFVRRGSFLADVGTDHAYLPIDLYKRGQIRGAVASDINRGPLERAVAHIRASGAGEGICTVLTDGLQGIEAYHPDDITIFGMGVALRAIADNGDLLALEVAQVAVFFIVHLCHDKTLLIKFCNIVKDILIQPGRKECKA